MPSITHFEIPADDIKRAQKFYSTLFGWEIEKTQGPFEYYMISTTDQDGQPGLGGGIMERQHPQQQITNYIEVSSIDETAAKVQQLGGQIIVEKTEVPDMGFFVSCLDTENNAFALWESA
jgi:predicted enzyme related to lactoylglutathione lyase